jgi:hypothetical protein
MRAYGKKLLDSALINYKDRELVRLPDGSFGKEKVKCLKAYYPTEVGFLVFDRPKVESAGSYYAEGVGLQFMRELLSELEQYKEEVNEPKEESSTSSI